jgi:DNA-binding protein HU-beta
MMSTTAVGADKNDKVAKREFVQRAARRGGIPLRSMQKAYDAMVEELLFLIQNGNSVTLSGFGRFYPHEHGGHKVQKRITDDPSVERETRTIDDYYVLKFSATREVNKQITMAASR